jgi:hypothetical protein
MPDFENVTPFGARLMPSADRDGRDLLLMVAAAHFALPQPGERNGRLRLLEKQEVPPLMDEYVGEPGLSSIRREGQLAYTRPATDVYLLGHACAPNGRPVTEMVVNIHVGPCRLDLRVFGDRVWQPAMTIGVVPSAPQPFLRMPLVWERAFGGVAPNSTERKPVYEPRNPVGCGLQTDPGVAIGKPLPNIEDPRQPVSRLSDRPTPVGVGPLARHWQPRVAYAGTYDEAWRRERAPVWPEDFDERFFCGAPSRLQAFPHLKGGESVVLQGLHPHGVIAFRLPLLRLIARSRFIDRTARTTLVLDGVLIDTDALELTMYFRSYVAAPLSLLKHRETLLRLQEPWEGDILQ